LVHARLVVQEDAPHLVGNGLHVVILPYAISALEGSFFGSFLHRQVSTEQILMMRARKDLTRRSSKTFIRSAQTGAIARAARRAAEQR
jgi:hypothetical protein